MDERRRVTVRGRRSTDLTPDRLGRARFRRQYIFAHAFEFWIAAAAAVTGLVTIVVPGAQEQSSVERVAGGLAYAWSALYLAGGATVLVSLVRSWKPSAWRMEVAGLCLLCSAVMIQLLSVVLHRGFAAAASVLTFGGLALATMMRIRALLVLAGVLHVEPRK